MITTITMLAVAARMPDWSPTIALIMVACNVLAIIFARATVKMPNVGPKIPIFSDVAGLSLPALLGANSRFNLTQVCHFTFIGIGIQELGNGLNMLVECDFFFRGH